MLKFAAISPHPPILLPSVGSKKQRKKVKETIDNLQKLEKKLKGRDINYLIIISPHPDWGFNVPLSFIGKDFNGETEKILVESENSNKYFELGKEKAKKLKDKKTAVIASGDLSHCLKKEGPYGYHPDGPAFDKNLINYLKKKKIKKILSLDKKFPNAKACGLQSIAFLLGF
ncbi:MAG: hypothetical protein ACOC1P_03750, partial [Minisyncoccales bacterium]